MMPAIKAELRKLLSVRSTYIITILVVAFVAFIAFYVEGWRLKPTDLMAPNQLASDTFGALNLSVFGAIIAILLMTHEYRYNTIIYTLTSSNNRGKVLIAKFIAVSCYALFLTVIIGLLSPIATYLGIHAHGHALGPQIFDVKDIIWRCLFYGWSYGIAGLLLAVLVRSQVAAIAALFIVPTAIESLLAQLLNKNAVYLPFTAQSQVVGNEAINGAHVSAARGALVFSLYLLVGWVVAWILFNRRDAN